MLALRGRLELFQSRYWRFLAKPWKLITFILSGGFFILAGRYTIDFTWDYLTGGMMSILTYTTAPWAAGTLWRLRNQFSLLRLWLVVSVWIFSASWCYDLYLLWRDHAYPFSWFSNLIASSCLYGLAGIFWNLDWSPQRGAELSFTRKDWPTCNPGLVWIHLWWIMAIIMCGAALFSVPLLKIWYR